MVFSRNNPEEKDKEGEGREKKKQGRRKRRNGREGNRDTIITSSFTKLCSSA
jgi:hypothetical protein